MDPKIQKINGAIARRVAEIFYNSAREELDTRPHFVPLDLETIRLTLQNKFDESLIISDIAMADKPKAEQLVNELKKYLNPEGGGGPIKNKITIKGPGIFEVYSPGYPYQAGDPLTAKVSPKSTRYKYLTAVVYNQSGDIIGILAPSFSAAGTAIIKEFFNKKIKQYLEDYSKKYNSQTTTEMAFDLGHIVDRFDSRMATTPLVEKTRSILKEVNDILRDPNFVGNRATLNSYTAGIYALYNKLKDRSSYAPAVQFNIDKDFQPVLLQLEANIVIVQDRYENQRIYADQLEKPLADYIINEATRFNFSRNLVEEISYRVKAGLEGIKIVPTKSKAKSSEPSRKTKTFSGGLTVGKSSAPKISNIKAIPASSVNITLLLESINRNLQEQIKKNMGKGDRKDVLNYRTGRFAQSVKIERMSESRQGRITAFYSYMKNPYATFSRGGRQERPYTRDPKLLISKSIRELAGQQVANRMRAVLI